MAEITEADPLEAAARRDRAVMWKIFAGVAFIIGVLTIFYIPSREAAGIVMLAVASGLGIFCGVYMWRATARINARDQGLDALAESAPEASDHLFLPESSPWPFGIALGATLILNGLVIGTWFLVPGAMALAVSLGGFARQSRHRYNR